MRLHFGLGESKKADQIEIRWPSGQTEVVKDIAANQIVTIKEGSGIVKKSIRPREIDRRKLQTSAYIKRLEARVESVWPF